MINSLPEWVTDSFWWLMRRVFALLVSVSAVGGCRRLPVRTAPMSVTDGWKGRV